MHVITNLMKLKLVTQRWVSTPDLGVSINPRMNSEVLKVLLNFSKMLHFS